MALFGRRARSDPHTWTELWELVARLDGRTSPRALGSLRAGAEAMTTERLLRARAQHDAAVRLLDTADHARHLTRDPWVGPDQTFGRRRFVRAMQAVIAAGPEAVLAVSRDASALARFDVGPVPGLAARLVADEPVDLGTGAEGLLLATVLRDVLVARGAARHPGWLEWTVSEGRSGAGHPSRTDGWPEVAAADRRARREEYPVDRYDPEAVWLHVWADFSATDRDGSEAGPGEWALPRLEATARVMEALGSANPPALGAVPVLAVQVGLDTDDTDDTDDVDGPGGPGAAAPGGTPEVEHDPDDPDHWLGDLVLGVERTVPATLLASTPPSARADLLTQQIARAILQGATFLTDDATARLTALV